VSLDRPLPSSPEIEKAILSLLMYGEGWSDCAGYLAPEDFYSDRHRAVYEAVVALEGKVIGEALVAEKLREMAKFDLVGRETLASIAAEVPAVTPSRYVDTLRRLSFRRRVIANGMALVETAFRGEEPMHAFAAKAAALFNESAAGRSRRGKTLAQLSREAMKRLGKRMESGEWVIGLGSGVGDLDRVTLGFPRRAATVIGARPGIAKTAFMLQTAIYLATQRVHSAIFQLDMSDELIGDRTLVPTSGVENFKIRSGQMISDSEMSQIIHEEIGACCTVNVSARTVQQIIAEARRQKAETGLDILFVDFIQLVDGGQGKAEHERISNVARQLLAAAEELDFALIMLAQLNRQAGDNEPPRMEHLRSCGDLEQIARIGILLDRPSLRGADAPMCRLDLIIGKYGEGQGHLVIETHFNLPLQQITNKGAGRCQDCRGEAPAPTPEPQRRRRGQRQLYA
jgi:replicative DNA helicase